MCVRVYGIDYLLIYGTVATLLYNHCADFCYPIICIVIIITSSSSSCSMLVCTNVTLCTCAWFTACALKFCFGRGKVNVKQHEWFTH